jgi:hypothetical protein
MVNIDIQQLEGSRAFDCRTVETLIEGVVFYTYLNLDGCLLLQAALTSDKKALL